MATMIEAEKVLEFLKHFPKTSKIKSIECFITAEIEKEKRKETKQNG